MDCGLAELAALSRVESSKAKQFFTSSTDRFRPPYGRCVVRVPRQCAFAGTVNEAEYLKDDTGNRRYWPVRVGKVDIDALRRDRDQLWAEAAARWAEGERWHRETPHEHELCRAEQDARTAQDPWLAPITEWLEKHGLPDVTTTQILMEAVGTSRSSSTRADSARSPRSSGSSAPSGINSAREAGTAPGSTGFPPRLWLRLTVPLRRQAPPPKAAARRAFRPSLLACGSSGVRDRSAAAAFRGCHQCHQRHQGISNPNGERGAAGRRRGFSRGPRRAPRDPSNRW